MDNEHKLELIRNRIIEQVAENMKYYGYAKTIGLVIAIIYYEGKPMNLDELAETTGMSKTRMSQVLREMEQLNIAEKIFIKGSRKDTYIAEKDLYETFLTLLTQNWQDLVHRNRKVDERLIRDLKEIINDENATEEELQKAKDYYNDSLKSLQYFDWIERLVHFFESKEVFKHVPIQDENE